MYTKINTDTVISLGDNAPNAKLLWGHSFDVLQDLHIQKTQVQSIITELPSYGIGDSMDVEWPQCTYKVFDNVTHTIPKQQTTLGLEDTVEDYIGHIVQLLDSAREVLKTNGTLWLACRDRYGEDKNLGMIPARIALALQAEGWILRNDIIWKWDNPNPESTKDRLTRTYGHIFMFAHPDSKGEYLYNQDSIREEHTSSLSDSYVSYTEVADGFSKRPDAHQAYHPLGRNKRDVWEVNLGAYMGKSNSPWPYELVVPMVLASSNEGDTVLDLLSGTAQTGKACLDNNRNYIGIDSNTQVRSEALARLQGIKQSRKAKQQWDSNPVVEMFGV
jgi:site-specific DNA-methyltransferase (adenine-specific)